MKQLQLIETCGGGSGRHLLDLVEGLTSLGHEVHVLYSPVRAEKPFIQRLKGICGVAVQEIVMKRSMGFSDIKAFLQVRRYIRLHGPFDVIHGHSSKGGALGRIAAYGTGAACVYTPHGLYTLNPVLSARKKLVFGMLEKILVRLFTDKVIAVSEREATHAIEKGFPAHKVSMVHNGVNLRDEDELARTRMRVRANLGVAESTRVIGFVGRFCVAKAAERFIYLAQEMKERRLDTHLVLLGSGDTAAGIEALIDQLGVRNYITVFPDKSGEEFMPAFDLYTLTSRYEAMPYVLLEALAAGLPIIATDVGGARTVIEQGVNGYVVPQQDDVSELADKVTRLVKDGELLVRMAEAARIKAREFSQEMMVMHTLQVYQSAISSSEYNGAPLLQGMKK